MNLAMVGDVMLGRLVNEALKERPPDYPWGNTLPLLRGADFRLCNLECAISDDGQPWSASPKEFHYRSDAKNVGVLLAAKVDAVSLANNHALDFGYDALLDMLEILDKAGIAHAGAGRTLKDAERAAALEVLGTKIGIIAFTDNEPGWEATSDRPGTFYVPVDLEDERAKRLLELVKETKKRVDLARSLGSLGPQLGLRTSSKTRSLRARASSMQERTFSSAIRLMSSGPSKYTGAGPSSIPPAISSTTTQLTGLKETTSRSSSCWKRGALASKV